MIKLTRLDGSVIHINPDLIETIEETPDTHITLMNGNRFLVLEKTRLIVEKIVHFKARIIQRSNSLPKQKYLRKVQAESYRPVSRQEEPE